MTCTFPITDDHSRVRLKEIPDMPGSDYINASHIDVSMNNFMFTNWYIYLQ